MAQFDVYRLTSGELVLDCQADTVSGFDTRFVVPLFDPDLVPNPTQGLHPRFTIDGQDRLMATQLAAAIEQREIAKVVLSLAGHRYTILNALDFLITGV